MALQEACKALPPAVQIELGHHFADQLYVRECHIPEGQLVIGKRQRKDHIVMLMAGEMTVLTDAGMERLEGPAIWRGTAGIKRAIITHTHCLIATIHHHPSNSKDLEDIDKEHLWEDVL